MTVEPKEPKDPQSPAEPKDPQDPPKDPEEGKKIAGSSFYQQKIKSISEENEALRKQIEEQKTASLKQKESYKELYEMEKEKREKAESTTADLRKTVYNSFKNSAIKDKAVEAGILPSAIDDLELLDNSIVEIETTDKGNISVLGASEFVESIKAKKPHWFSNTKAPNINITNPTEDPTPRKLTPEEIVALEKKDPKKYKEYMANRNK